MLACLLSPGFVDKAQAILFCANGIPAAFCLRAQVNSSLTTFIHLLIHPASRRCACSQKESFTTAQFSDFR